MKQIKLTGVIGGGLMGRGIAQTAAAAGYQVIMCDVSLGAAQKGLAAISGYLQKNVAKGRLTEAEAGAIAGRISLSGNYADLADADVVFEAIYEQMQAKRDLYAQLDKICKPECIFASNTSGLSITEMAAATKRPDRFIGAHFFNPVPVMQLLEIVRGYHTSDTTYKTIYELGVKMGKEPVTVNEAPSFVVNRLLIPMINEAVFVLFEGTASKEDIDKSMRLGANHPIGPLALADLIGLDTVLAIMESLLAETGDGKYRPCPLLRKMVRAGSLGRKSGAGFYNYT